MLKVTLRGSIATLTLLTAVSVVKAGGLERSSQDFDILFEDGNVVETGATFVIPQRKLKNITGGLGPDNPVPGPNYNKPYDTSVDEGKSYWVPKLSAKFQLTDDLACAAQYRQPWGIDTNVGTNNVRMFSAIEQKITSRDYGVNCSYRFTAGEKGYFRLLGGLSYQELTGYQTQMLPAQSIPNLGSLPFRIGTLDVEDAGFGWRLGAAYEIPEIALRASLIYQSEIKYGLSGKIDGIFPSIPAANVMGKVAAPQSVELKLQTGITANWLALASVKWVDWSKVDQIRFNNTGGQYGTFVPNETITTLNLYYRDGWTVMGGIGHKFNEKWSGAATLTWDRGTSTGLTSQTDVWLVGLGTNYKATEQLELRLAGAVGVLTSGSLDNTLAAKDGGSQLGSKADFGTDVVGGVTLSAKYKF